MCLTEDWRLHIKESINLKTDCKKLHSRKNREKILMTINKECEGLWDNNKCLV